MSRLGPVLDLVILLTLTVATVSTAVPVARHATDLLVNAPSLGILF